MGYYKKLLKHSKEKKLTTETNHAITQILELAGTSNTNRLNTLVKIQILPDWIKIASCNYMLLTSNTP